ncbi:MAG: prolyl oligopeptidase family serine peptidase [Planctomyces sp.]|nr:prolyl oligopeptidase family serine peptidase [Planctomyces sp.]
MQAWIHPLFIVSCLMAALLQTQSGFGQALGEPDRGSPGDEAIQAYLHRETMKLSASFEDDLKSLEQWKNHQAEYREEFMYMLGLSPRPAATPLHATVTSTLVGDDISVEMLHYQSMPGLYVTGNLYRPAIQSPGQKFPAVFYVCGHSGRGRNGNKVAFQSHGIWLARHGYVCLIVDALQLGEIGATHHGTYHLNRWWWHSRGYTSAGVEAWNGIRGIDYLISRPDVDAEQIAVTGISGGGAATFWIAAGDPRVRAAIPVSGMADLESYVPNRVINGHCDCMFFYNTFQWPWTRIAGLVAPRPMLFINSDQDPIFPMDANERIINRLERLYRLYGAGNHVDAVVSAGGHAYREDIRRSAYEFLNLHLRHDAKPVTDSERDVVSEGVADGPYPIPPERLRVFPQDEDLPKDQKNTIIDELFVPMASVSLPEQGKVSEWQSEILRELRRVTFRSLPESIEAATAKQDSAETFTNADEVPFRIRELRRVDESESIFLAVLSEEEAGSVPQWIEAAAADQQSVYLIEPRGTGNYKWTRRNPPNYVERSHVLLGRTVDTGRIRDVISAARLLAHTKDATTESSAPNKSPSQRTVRIEIAGNGSGAVIAACAAMLADREIQSVCLVSCPESFMSSEAPQLLNVLRVCDIPELCGLLAPRRLRLIEAPNIVRERVSAVYSACDASSQLNLQ